MFMENRYDKYKDSGIAWIGEIPEHWEVRKLKNVCSTNNASLSDKTSKEFEFDYVDIGSVSFELGIHKTEKYTFQNAPSRARKIARLGDIIVSTVRTYLRAIDIINSEEKEKYIYSTGFAVLSPLKNILSEFMIYICRSEYFTNQVSIYSTGINYPSINDTALKMINIVMPHLSEQQSIAYYLDQKCGEIDKLITLQEEMITKLQSYKQSVITEAVTKGLDKNVPLKDSGIEWIGEIPEHWTFTVFKKFLSEPMQYGANEPAEECNYNDPRYIRITDIKDDGTLRDDTFKSLPLEKAKEYMLNKGDLLFARSGATVGKTFLYKEDYAACFAGYLIKARCNKNVLLPNFVFYYTLSNVYQNWKNSIFIQSTIQNIGADKYSVMPIIVPSLSEQQSIADYLDQKCSEIDELISIKQQKIEKLKDYKKSLIFECVTGKRKV
mgnify:CR=1 FL=1